MGTENFKIIEVTDFKKKVFLNISQNSQEHFCAAVFFIEKFEKFQTFLRIIF